MRRLAVLFAGWATFSTAFGQGVWETRASYPIEATEVSSAAIDGKVYSVCGLTPRGSVNSLFIYDPYTDAWKTGAPAPIAGGGDHCNVAAANGKLYLLGAIRIGSSFIDGNTYEYDPAQDRWQAVARMPTPRGASGVAAIGNKIYVAGGLTAAGSIATFEAFDVVSRQWTRLPDMPTARDHLTAQALNGKFYAISGRVGDVLRANEEFDPATNAWHQRAPIPTPRGGLASGVINNRIQVFGGEGPSGTPEGTYRENEEYDPAADTWRALASMPTPRHGLYGATADGRVFVPSGGPRAGANYSIVHEAFYLPPSEPVQAQHAVNAASFAGTLSPGALVSVGGQRLSFGEQVAVRFPLPTQMNAVMVKVNGTAVPLLYAGPRPGQFSFTLLASAGSGSTDRDQCGKRKRRPGSSTARGCQPGDFCAVARWHGPGCDSDRRDRPDRAGSPRCGIDARAQRRCRGDLLHRLGSADGSARSWPARAVGADGGDAASDHRRSHRRCAVFRPDARSGWRVSSERASPGPIRHARRSPGDDPHRHGSEQHRHHGSTIGLLGFQLGFQLAVRGFLIGCFQPFASLAFRISRPRAFFLQAPAQEADRFRIPRASI
jgi:N-acetylneuraminic acid mutarotase